MCTLWLHLHFCKEPEQKFVTHTSPSQCTCSYQYSYCHNEHAIYSLNFKAEAVFTEEWVTSNGLLFFTWCYSNLELVCSSCALPWFCHFWDSCISIITMDLLRLWPFNSATGTPGERLSDLRQQSTSTSSLLWPQLWMRSHNDHSNASQVSTGPHQLWKKLGL